MRTVWQGTLQQNLKVLMNRLGYFERLDRATGRSSFIRRLGGAQYPRFHLYVAADADQMSLDLHLDARQASYAGKPRHVGEYDGDQVRQEMARILSSIPQ